MREYYICDKMEELRPPLSEEGIEAILRMERNNRMARIMNTIQAHIEEETERYKHELCGYVIHVLEKEL